MFNHALVCGKFFPFHVGHQNLIDQATQRARRVTIFVVHGLDEVPDGSVRLQWLRDAYPQHSVRLVANLFTDDAKAESSEIWAHYTKQILQEDMPDVVFSSEEYGQRWAAAMHCDHVLLDKQRSMYAISGTKIREDIYGWWHMIHPVAQRFYLKKVLLVGAESVGKTTLAMKLAKHYGTFFVPEYGRIYVEQNGVDETVKREIFPAILNNQPEMEDAMAQIANKILVCDTCLYTTKLWYDVWQHREDALRDLIHQMAIKRAPSYDLVLLPDYVNTPWVDDGLRDQETTRGWFTKELEKFYEMQNVPLICLQGNWEARWETALKYIDNLLGDQTLIQTLVY